MAVGTQNIPEMVARANNIPHFFLELKRRICDLSSGNISRPPNRDL